jgi:hypothetical protein
LLSIPICRHHSRSFTWNISWTPHNSTFSWKIVLFQNRTERPEQKDQTPIQSHMVSKWTRLPSVCSSHLCVLSFRTTYSMLGNGCDFRRQGGSLSSNYWIFTYLLVSGVNNISWNKEYEQDWQIINLYQWYFKKQLYEDIIHAPYNSST